MTKWKMCLRARLVVMVAILLATTIANTIMADEAADSNDEVTETEADATATVDEEAPPEGFRNTTWGMSKSEVTKALSPTKVKWNKKDKALVFEDKILFGKYEFQLHFCENEGLCHVEIYLKDKAYKKTAAKGITKKGIGIGMSKGGFGSKYGGGVGVSKSSPTGDLDRAAKNRAEEFLMRYNELRPILVNKYGDAAEDRDVGDSPKEDIAECEGHVRTIWTLEGTQVIVQVDTKKCELGEPIMKPLAEYKCSTCTFVTSEEAAAEAAANKDAAGKL